MATDFTQDSVLWFLRDRGGTVKNSDLLAHFRPFLRDHDDRLRHREHFKKFVNSVATVKQEEGVSYVVLRKRFRGPDAGSPSGRQYPTRSPDGRKASDPGADRRSRSPAHPTPGKTLRPHASAITHPEEPTITPTGDLLKTTESNILPSAGILIDNNNYAENNFNLVKKSLPSSTPDVPQRAACRPLLAHGREEPVPCRTQVRAPAGTTAHPHPLRSPATSSHQPVHPRVEHHLVSAGVQSVVETTPRHKVEEYHLQQNPSPILHQHEALHHNTGLKVRARGTRYRKSYKSAVSQDDDDDEEEEEGEVAEVVPRTADSAGGEILMSRPPQDNRRTVLSSLPPSLSPPSHPPSLTPSLPTSLPPSVPYSPPTSLPSSCPLSLTPSLPTSQPPNLHSPTPSSSTPSLPSLTPALSSSSLPSSSTPSFPVSLSSLPSLSPCSRPPSLPTSQPPNHPSSPTSPFPFSLHSSLPSSLPSSQPSLFPFLSTSPQSQTSEKFSGSPGSRLDPVPTIHIQDLGEPCLEWSSGPGSARGAPPEASASGGIPKQSPGSSGRGPGRALGMGLSSSHDSLLLPSSSSCSDWLSPLSSGAPSGAEWNSSNEEMGCLKGDAGVRVANDNRLLSLMHRSEKKTTTPWHHSTGHLLEEGDPGSSLYRSTGNLLDNQEEAESSEGAASPLVLRKRPSAARRVSSRLRSRKCMSLGEGLDLPFPGEEETQGGGIVSARHNRLHLLSSSLSLRYNLSSSSLSSSGSTPPRYPSLGELAEGKEQSRGGGAGRGTDGSHSYHKQVPLESREHAWLVKGAAGAWTDIYSLFREDSSLLHRPDFISGFTVLHWIAKHGDHRVLNTLWYGVNKLGLTLDINVRAWNGCTPLHLATMHGHKKMVRVLVQTYHADVRRRDTAGKRAWQYLEAPPPPDLLHLLGGPQRTGGRAPLHHHASCSTADRPQRRPLTTRVKRSTSIAAFLKHKSLLRFRDLSDVSL